MKLKQEIKPVQFLQAVQACVGQVLFLTADGDRLNLKSQLCSYVFAFLCSKPEVMENARLQCSEQQDYERLSGFLAEE